MMLRKVVSLIICLMLISALFFVNANAEVTVLPGAQDIPEEVLDGIIADCNGGNITIYEWGTCQAGAEPKVIGPIVIFGFDVVSKVKTEHHAIAKDEFIISVARGMSLTLSSEITYSLECSVTGKASYTDLGITPSISKTYTVQVVWNGPEEGSTYNTREYRIRFFENRGTYTGYQTLSGVQWGDLETGTWEEPVQYALYSQDQNIVPIE